jgi:hypothetical protein
MDTFWYAGQLAFRNYQPEKIEKGMLYINILYPGSDREQFEIYSLDRTPVDQDAFISEYGYPVELFIVEDDDAESVLAEPDEIGWFDFEDKLEWFVQISLKEINIILNEYQGWLEILTEYDEENDLYIPLLKDDFVVIRFFQEEDEEEE